MTSSAPDYLTTTELADLLRIKQRKVYDLAASGELPCTRAMGKLLFPRSAVEAWLAEHGSAAVHGGTPTRWAPTRPNVFLGSHDPLLDWALRESRSGIASFFDGSLDGLDRFVAGEGIATGLHIFAAAAEHAGGAEQAEAGEWNRPAVAQRCRGEPVVLVEWAWRERGLITAPDNPRQITGIADLRGLRFVPRQPEAGAQVLFEQLLAEAALPLQDLDLARPARSETDAALAVLDGGADATLGLAAVAHQYRLGFVPLVRERFDLLVWRKAWFDLPMQRLLAFCRTATFAAKAREMTGYDIAGLGHVHFNGP